MSGIFWHIITFFAAGIFIALMIYRIISIKRMPVHLRWELAPIPHEKGKSKYGGSYLEEYEWWRKPKRRKSFTGPIIYMAREIFLLEGVWKNNRSLWPFSLLLHYGIYFFILTLVLYFINALLIVKGAPLSVQSAFQGIASVTSAAAYILGTPGVAGLFFKRALDPGLRNYSSFSTFFRLAFLGAVFISGLIARFSAADYASEMSLYVNRIITLDSGAAVSIATGTHIIIVLLFIIYLPWTDMVHFITKYFTYHAVRWDDEPKDKNITEKLSRLVNQPVDWSAPHINPNGRKNWADTIAGEHIEKEKS